MKPQQIRELYHFGAFRMNAAERRLWCDDEPVPLTPKQFDLLFYFVENAGSVAKKDELLGAVWNDSYVEESTLARNVSWLRKKLDNGGDGKQIIETVSKLGYRFTAEVTHSAADEDVIIIEEQTVQQFRGEEIITIDDAFAETWKREDADTRRLKDVENKPSILPNVPAAPRYRRVPATVFLILLLAALTGIGFVIYLNYFTADTRAAGLNVGSKIIIKNTTVDGTKEIVDAGIAVQPGDIISISTDGKYQTVTGQYLTYEGDKTAEVSTDYAFQNADPGSLVGWIGTQSNKIGYFQVSNNNSITANRSGKLYFALNNRRQKHHDISGGFVIGVTLTRTAESVRPEITIGSVIHLKNQYSDDAGYLDAWGKVKNKPEFSQVSTELMFVSTHENPNRENGSGSWKILSAAGKKEGETLVYGDEIHLLNMYPDAGHLDNCGWLKDMPIFKDFAKAEKFAVFTAHSEDRDNGTGTWIVSSNTEFEGIPVFEGASISLETGFSGGGFLDTKGRVDGLPAFDNYDGSLLVFIHESSASRRPSSGIWTISGGE